MGGKMSFPLHKPPFQSYPQQAIRSHFIYLIGVDRLYTSAARDEASEFAALWDANDGQCNHCCSASDFRVDLFGSPHSAWNVSAARVFCKDFRRFHKLPSTASDDITRSFFTRVKTLKAELAGLNQDRAEQTKIARAMRRYRRKTTVCSVVTHNCPLLICLKLFHRRFEMAQTHPGLQKHVHILQRLGVQGMSSDESDHDVVASHPPARRTNPRYLVRNPEWRAADLTYWLRTFDAGHMIERRSVEGGSRGAFPRLRVYNAESSNISKKKTFVRGLPINAYDQQWLARRKDIQFCVTPDEQRYDFSHDPDILE